MKGLKESTLVKKQEYFFFFSFFEVVVLLLVHAKQRKQSWNVSHSMLSNMLDC